MGKRYNLSAYWADQRQQQEKARKGGLVGVCFSGRRFQVVSPYMQAFAAWAKANRGSWRPRSQVWSFPRSETHAVMAQLLGVYGVTWESGEVRSKWIYKQTTTQEK